MAATSAQWPSIRKRARSQRPSQPSARTGSGRRNISGRTPRRSRTVPRRRVQARRSRRRWPRCERQYRVMGITAERALEFQLGTGSIRNSRQRSLEIVARRDVEHPKPSPQQRAGEVGQSFLAAEIDNVQTAAGCDAACRRLQNATPIRHHREAVGNEDVIERWAAEQYFGIERGSVAMYEAIPVRQAAPRNDSDRQHQPFRGNIYAEKSRVGIKPPGRHQVPAGPPPDFPPACPTLRLHPPPPMLSPD